MTAVGPTTARIRIKRATDAVHTRLHGVAALSRLAASGVTAAQVRTALTFFHALYHHIEETRRAVHVWPEFSLHRELAALDRDLDGAAPPPAEPGPQVSASALLGQLYVAHGAAFGRSTFLPNVRAHAPDAPSAFLCLKSDPEQWRSLVRTLDRIGVQDPGALAEIEGGALSAFERAETLAQRLVHAA